MPSCLSHTQDVSLSWERELWSEQGTERLTARLGKEGMSVRSGQETQEGSPMKEQSTAFTERLGPEPRPSHSLSSSDLPLPILCISRP